MPTYSLTLDERPTAAQAADGIQTPAHNPHTHAHERGVILHWGDAHILIPDEPNDEGQYVIESTVPIEYDAEASAIVVLDFAPQHEE